MYQLKLRKHNFVSIATDSTVWLLLSQASFTAHVDTSNAC